MFNRHSTKHGHNDHFPLLQKHLVHGVYDIMAAGPTAPTKDDIKAFEKKWDITLPRDFVSFSVSQISGIYVNVKEEYWPPSKEYDVRPFWAFCSGLYVFSFSDDAPDFMNIEKKMAEFREETDQVFVPCLSIVSNADFFGFTADGKVGQWIHDEGIIEKTDRSFLDLLDHELGELAKRQAQMEGDKEKYSK